MDRSPIGIIKDMRLLTGIICHESATYLHNLSTFPSSPVLRFCKNPPKKQPMRYIFVKPFDESRMYEETMYLGGSLYVTSPKRTITDLVACQGTEEVIYQSLETYLGGIGTADDLLDYAETYGVRKEMQGFIDTLDKWLSFDGS